MVLSCFLHELTFTGVEQHLTQSAGLIVPIGATEPSDASTILGASSLCCRQLAFSCAVKNSYLCSPVLPVSCSVPFSAFGGTAGVKPRTFSNFLLELMRGWAGQGFKNFILIDAGSYNQEAIALMITRIKKSFPDRRISVLSLHNDHRIKEFIKIRNKTDKFGLIAYGIRSIAAFLDKTAIHDNLSSGIKIKTAGEIEYATWRKRGKDPQMFRKLFPLANATEDIAAGDADFGKELFGYILTLLDEYAASIFPERNPE